MSVSHGQSTAMNEINSFSGEHAFLSNFFERPVLFDGAAYKSTEHAYQAAKSLDPQVREVIQSAQSPREARRLGQMCELRDDWDEVKIPVMEEVLRYKFSEPSMKRKLMETAPAQLIEGNTWGDRFWGAEREFGKWVGENNLGKLLMKLRDEYIAEESSS